MPSLMVGHSSYYWMTCMPSTHEFTPVKIAHFNRSGITGLTRFIRPNGCKARRRGSRPLLGKGVWPVLKNHAFHWVGHHAVCRGKPSAMRWRYRYGCHAIFVILQGLMESRLSLWRWPALRPLFIVIVANAMF